VDDHTLTMVSSVHGRVFAARGYHVLIQSVRGKDDVIPDVTRLDLARQAAKLLTRLSATRRI